MEIDLKGSWTGLAHWKDMITAVDYFSSPDDWRIGFDIVFRIMFIPRENNFDIPALKAIFREAFKNAFDLDDDHFETNQWEPGGVFWRIYWDKDSFDIKLLGKCEDELNKCGQRNRVAVLLLGETIIPRSASYVASLIAMNHK